ncbi:MAG: Ig-like domain-containing protein, partial [Ruminococcus sp.]|nr:Ig-like domain-containing protein [Ruminococcus sp.]
MKKITAWLLTALLAAGSCVSVFAAESDATEAVTIGDADGDGTITIGDVTLIQQFAAEIAAQDAIQTTAADVNRDGVVSIDDATIIQRYLAEFIADFDEWKPEEPVDPLVMEPTELTLEPGESAKLNASAAAEFVSGDTAVATVDADGNVTAVNAGETVITATDEYGQTASCTVSVRITPPSKLTVSQPMLALGVGES